MTISNVLMLPASSLYWREPRKRDRFCLLCGHSFKEATAELQKAGGVEMTGAFILCLQRSLLSPCWGRLPTARAGKENTLRSRSLSWGLVYLIIFLSFISTVHFNIHLFCISSPWQDVCHQCFFQFLTHLLYALFLFPCSQNKKMPVIWQVMEIYETATEVHLYFKIMNVPEKNTLPSH